MKIRLAIRGFAPGGRELFTDHVVLEESREFGSQILKLATDHAEKVASHPMHMIEIEFLDEPDQNQRFFRIGTDPDMMIRPLRVTP